MKLDPKGVKKAANAVFDEWGNGQPLDELMAAALTAYFDHLKAEGLMREADFFRYSDGRWYASERGGLVAEEGNIGALIIRTDKD